MITGPATTHDQARATVLAWQQGIDAASNWFTDHVEGIQERWPKFLDNVGRTADGVGEAIGDYLEGVGERWDQLVGGEDRSAGMS